MKDNPPAPNLSPIGGSELALHWLAGLLEGEGTFLKPPPSRPRAPIVRCRMTDRDVVERVAQRFSTKIVEIDRGRHRTEYAATLKGASAVALMRDLRPLMGRRRTQAIDEAIRAYTAPRHKLSFSSALEIRDRYRRGESVSSLARRFNVARQSIHAVLKGRIYRGLPPRPWHVPLETLPQSDQLSLSVQDLCWLAGWLEGEGSFCSPPPSDPGRPRVSAQTCDPDVAVRAAALLRVTAGRRVDPRGRDRGWSPIYSILVRGRRAVALMSALQPLMGARRQAQIRHAIPSLANGAPLPLGIHGGVLASTWS